MSYLILKALHVLAVVTWIGSMLFVSALLPHIDRSTGAERLHWAATVQGVARRFDTPAMLLTWLIGVTLLVLGGWLSSPWMLGKIALVFLLSALHGVLSGQMKKLAEQPEHRSPGWTRWLLPAELIAVAAVIGLVVLKPG